MIKEILLFVTGIAVGGMNAIAGGGMLLGFPVLLLAGLSPLAANVTTTIIVLPGQISSAFGYREYLRKLSPRYLILLLPCMIGGAGGALLLRNTSNERFQEMVPVLILFAVLLFAFQPFLRHHLQLHLSKKRGSIGGLYLIALGLLPTAFYGGYFGAGFGFIMLAFLSFTKLKDIHQINGLKNLAGVSICTVAVICLFSSGKIDWHHGLAMSAGTAIGGYCGARLSQRVNSHVVRIIVLCIGFVAAGYLAFRAY
jgi:uncharacterized membrane protein YfcA